MKQDIYYRTTGTISNGKVVRPWKDFKSKGDEWFSIHGEGAALRVVGIKCEVGYESVNYFDCPVFAMLDRNGKTIWLTSAELLTDEGRAEVDRILDRYRPKMINYVND